jgi:cardiolipin synthase
MSDFGARRPLNPDRTIGALLAGASLVTRTTMDDGRYHVADDSDELDLTLGHLKGVPAGADPSNLRNALESTVGAIFQSGHRVTVLRNGDEIFPAMLEAIGRAEHTIDFVTFVYWQGEIARRFADALAERSLGGVRVRVVLDALGSAPMKRSLIRKMSGAGIAVERFRPTARWKFWEADHRTHRKILVVDNEVAFTGGVGIASEWEGDARGPSEWRDSHFRIEGPMVLALKAAFLTDWRDTGHSIDLSDARIERPAEAGDTDVALLDGSAQIGFNDAERALETVAAAAEHRIIMQTPYFNPTEALLELLRSSLARGVELDLLVPGPHIDKRISEVMAVDMYRPLLEMGGRVWRYQPTMMHAKVVLVDGVLSIVGSMNLNRRSVHKDEEAAVAVLDPDVTATLERHFVEDVAESEPASIADDDGSQRLVAKLLKPISREI